jgi:SAM-dependent methyltransferase
MSAKDPHNSGYIHGTDPAEQLRLSRLNDFFNASSLRELNLRGGETILDVGSGLGQFARAMARTGGADARVIGIERSAEQLAEARRLAAADGEESLVDFRQGDAIELPLSHAEWCSFDLAHARFLLEHVRQPQRVVDAMVRAVRPGGRIILCDDDHDLLRLWPEPPGFVSLWQTYIRTYDRLGNDAFVGRRLVSLLERAGAQPVRNTLIYFGGCAGQPLFPAVVENMIGILSGARAAILDVGAIEPAAFDETIAAFRAWSQRPGAAFWYAASWAEGVRLQAATMNSDPQSAAGR